MTYVFLLFIWSVLSIASGTAVISVRIASRSRLLLALKQRGREHVLDLIDAHEHEYALTALIYRQLATALFVITICVKVVAGDAPLVWYWAVAEILGITIIWFLIVAIALPAACARYLGEAFLARSIGVLEAARRITWPGLWLIHGIDEIVRRLAGVPSDANNRAEQMEQEILDAVRQAETTGAVDQTERDMIRSVMVLDETSAGEVMTPRTDMIGIEVSASYDEVRLLLREVGHSRIPVYEETLDRVIGVLYAKDLLRIEDKEAFDLRQMMRDVPFVPETKDLASLLREFQAQRVHIAIVLDEYGGTAGLVTIEDILEELVGDITDEHEEPPTPSIHQIDERTAEVDARVRVDELNDALDVALPEDEAYDTIGGFVFSRLGRVPAPGETLDHDGVKIEIVDASERAINRVRIRVNAAVRQE